jgi:hypothetical protein
MAKSADRNALGQGAVGSCQPTAAWLNAQFGAVERFVRVTFVSRGRPAAGSVGVLYRRPTGAWGTERHQLAGRLLLGAEVREEDQSATFTRWAGWWLICWWAPVGSPCPQQAVGTPAGCPANAVPTRCTQKSCVDSAQRVERVMRCRFTRAIPGGCRAAPWRLARRVAVRSSWRCAG